MALVTLTDGSGRSLAVVPHAWRLARALKEPLVAVRVLDPVLDCADEMAPTLEEAIAKVSARWREELGRELASAGVGEAEIEIPVRAHRQEAPDTALAAAERLGAVAIAMGTRGAGRIRQALFGSTAMRVLRESKCPLLLAGPAVELPVIGERYHVLLTSDGSPAAESIVPALRPLMEEAGMQVTFWQACTPRPGDMGEAAETEAGRARLRWLAEQLPEGVTADVRVEWEKNAGAIPKTIIERAGSVGATAIAMSTHGHSARYNLLAGSTAMAVIQRSPLPILTVRARDGVEPRL